MYVELAFIASREGSIGEWVTLHLKAFDVCVIFFFCVDSKMPVEKIKR